MGLIRKYCCMLCPENQQRSSRDSLRFELISLSPNHGLIFDQYRYNHCGEPEFVKCFNPVISEEILGKLRLYGILEHPWLQFILTDLNRVIVIF